jgi:tetracycline 7-halogenase / FADH2 O2-dependent halogenase
VESGRRYDSGLKEQFAEARAMRPFVHMPRMAFRSSEVAGERWALLPSAAGFVDPLLSTGIPLTLLGVSRIAEIIERDWGTQRFNASNCKHTRRKRIAN